MTKITNQQKSNSGILQFLIREHNIADKEELFKSSSESAIENISASAVVGPSTSTANSDCLVAEDKMSHQSNVECEVECSVDGIENSENDAKLLTDDHFFDTVGVIKETSNSDTISQSQKSSRK